MFKFLFNQKGQVAGVALSIIVFIVLIGIVMTFGWVNIKPTEAGVQIQKLEGKVLDKPLGVGYHFFNRWLTDVVTYNVATRSYPRDILRGNKAGDKMIFSFKTTDGQNVRCDFTVQYSLKANDVSKLHAEVGVNYEQEILMPKLRSISRIMLGSYSAEELYQGSVRDDIQDAIKRRLQKELSQYYIIVQASLIRDFKFSSNFEKKIEEKKLASQQVEINKNRALAQEEEAKRQEAEARGGKLKAVQEAQGRAESAKIEADANRYKLEQEALGQLAKYKADAEGKRLKAEALGGGHNVVALEFASKLAPTLKVIGVPIGTNSTSIMDLNGVTKGLFTQVHQ